MMSSTVGKSDLNEFWLFTGLRQIIILESALEKFISLLISLQDIDDVKLLTNTISNIQDICYSFQYLQRIKLMEFLILKVGEHCNSSDYYLRIRSVLVFIYCLPLYGYRDQDKLSKEISEISNSIDMIQSHVLRKLASQENKKSEHNNHIYGFCVTFINQIQLWVECNGFSNKKLESLDKSVFQKNDIIGKSLLYLNKRLTKPLEKVSTEAPMSFDHILISSFYGLMTRKALKKIFVVQRTSVPIKRSSDSNLSSNNLSKSARMDYSLEKNIKIDSDLNNFPLINQKLIYLIDCSSREVTTALLKDEIIETLKLSPKIIVSSQKYLYNEETNDRILHEEIYVNLLKLWNVALRLKWTRCVSVDLYFCAFLSLDIKDSINFKPLITEFLQIIANFQAVLNLKTVENPFFVLEILSSCLETVLHNSTTNRDLSSQQRLELSDLMSEIGKVIEILIRPQDKEHWSRVIILIPQRLFEFFANLENSVHPDVMRTLKKTVISPITQIINKFALKHMKVLVKGAAKEVCKDLLEIKFF